MGAARSLLRALGFDVVRYHREPRFAPDFSPADNQILLSCMPYTTTSAERLYAVIEGVRYITRARISGAVVECGVWRGGSLLATALALRECHDTERELYGFDTFAGMVAPGTHDVDYLGEHAGARFSREKFDDSASSWCAAGVDDVMRTIQKSGHDDRRLHLVKGRVEDTIPASAPSGIALLRLDTDWYESTRHELEHLFPRLAIGGVLIVDDYGHWKGSRKAVDEYFAKQGISLMLNRIDYTGRLAIKR